MSALDTGAGPRIDELVNGVGRHPAGGIDALLARARARITRLTPRAAASAVEDGALLVDIRPQAQRLQEGDVPLALVVERNVLEWRFDPTSRSRWPMATFDLQVLVLCSEGYTSSLAAAALADLGVHRAGDVRGGFRAWKASGLPTRGGAGS